jgi:hypothetical protein
VISCDATLSAWAQPAFAILMTIFILAGALFLAEESAVEQQSNSTAPTASDERFRNGWETMWVCFWLVATLGYDGYLGSGQAAGRLIIAAAIVSGLLFTTMPITIIGEAFRAAWEKKELIEVQMKIQELLIERGLTLSELHLVFAEFDTSGALRHLAARHSASRALARARAWSAPLVCTRANGSIPHRTGDMQLDWSEFKGAQRRAEEAGCHRATRQGARALHHVRRGRDGRSRLHGVCGLLEPRTCGTEHALDASAWRHRSAASSTPTWA